MRDGTLAASGLLDAAPSVFSPIAAPIVPHAAPPIEPIRIQVVRQSEGRRPIPTPVSGAVATVWDAHGRSGPPLARARSDAAGVIVLDGVEPGRYILDLSHEGEWLHRGPVDLTSPKNGYLRVELRPRTNPATPPQPPRRPTWPLGPALGIPAAPDLDPRVLDSFDWDALDVEVSSALAKAPEPTPTPDFILDAENQAVPVTPVPRATLTLSPVSTPEALLVEMTAQTHPGWNFFRIQDPTRGTQHLLQVERADGQVLPWGTQVWLSQGGPGAGAAITHENGHAQSSPSATIINILDRDGNGTYRLRFIPHEIPRIPSKPALPLAELASAAPTATTPPRFEFPTRPRWFAAARTDLRSMPTRVLGRMQLRSASTHS